MGTVTISVDKSVQSKLDFIKQHTSSLAGFAGDELTKKFFYGCVDKVSSKLGYSEKKA